MVLGSFIDPTGHWDQVSKPDQNRLLKRHIWHTCGIDRINIKGMRPLNNDAFRDVSRKKNVDPPKLRGKIRIDPPLPKLR